MAHHKFDERNIAWGHYAPCKDCPFRKDVPGDKKGIQDDLQTIALTLGGETDMLFSCHKTDPRVTDGGFDPTYQGPLKHCAGLLLMMKKEDKWSGAALRAMARGKLDPLRLKATNLVHGFNELIVTILRAHMTDDEIREQFRKTKEKKAANQKADCSISSRE